MRIDGGMALPLESARTTYLPKAEKTTPGTSKVDEHARPDTDNTQQHVYDFTHMTPQRLLDARSRCIGIANIL